MKANADNYLDEYLETLRPLFSWEQVDPMGLTCALVRAGGLESAPSDPLQESLETLNDLQALTTIALPADSFELPTRTSLRLRLLSYAHIVEMNAPYDVLGNLFRLKLGLPFSTRPFLQQPSKKKKQKKLKPPGKSGPPPGPAKKIPKIKELAGKANLPSIGSAFDQFYSGPLRNAISHADYVLTENDLRIRGGYLKVPPDGNILTPIMPLDRLTEMIERTFAFYSAFFALEKAAREALGAMAGKPISYDTSYKGVLELIADTAGLVTGFVLHWPNGMDTIYERTHSKCIAQNFSWDEDGCIVPMVGLCAKQAGNFSPLVEQDAAPMYTDLRSGERLAWPK